MPDLDPNAPAPIPPLHGQKELRGSQRVSLSPIYEGRFGRMFRRLSPMAPLPDEALEELAQTMLDEETPSAGWGADPTPTPRDNPRIPAGYTYFGQFIDHDITFDPVTSAERMNDRDAIINFRSPALDLDSVYGSGPADEPFQYVQDSNGMKLLLGENANHEKDLPRNSEGIALIGDPRNDENTIVSQLHLAFLKLHNKLATEVAEDESVPRASRREEAQLRTRWHYQWAVMHDFIPKIIGDELFEQITDRDDEGRVVNVDRPNYRPRKNAYIPIEFAGAAYRFGHSMVRGIYDLNPAPATGRPIFVPGELQNETQDLRGRRPLVTNWTIQWNLFFDRDHAQPSRLIDTKIVRGLFSLPGGRSLPLLNLQKSQFLKLPSGQDVAIALGEEPLSATELEGVPDPTPLWFYILKEAEKRADGLHLGKVGGRIVGEVLLGLVELDKQSWMNVNPGWRPSVPDADGDGVVGVPDLVAFATSP